MVRHETIAESVIQSSPWWVEVETRDVYDAAASGWEELTYYYLTNGKVRAMMLEDPSEVTAALRSLYPRLVAWWADHHEAFATQNEFYQLFTSAQWRAVYEEAARRVNAADWMAWRAVPWNRRTEVAFEREEPQPCAAELGRLHEDLCLVRSSAVRVVEALTALSAEWGDAVTWAVGDFWRTLDGVHMLRNRARTAVRSMPVERHPVDGGGAAS